nr:MAG TPA: hypothetical protein [Caudoviricetes sp.]
MKNIKLVYVNGDYTYTRINGTEEEIIDYYNFNNVTNGDIDTQVKEIEIEADPVGFTGCSARTIIYPFTYNEASECYLYE